MREIALTDATEAEHRVADRLLDQARKRRWRIKTIGADKGYCVRDVIGLRRARGIAPHVARIEHRRTPGLDARTTRYAGYAISQRKRKRVEEIFGWLKTYGGLRKTRFVGQARVALHTTLAATAYNLLRMAKLAPPLRAQSAAATTASPPNPQTQGSDHESIASCRTEQGFCIGLLTIATDFVGGGGRPGRAQPVSPGGCSDAIFMPFSTP